MRYRWTLLLAVPFAWVACVANNDTGGGEDASMDLDSGATGGDAQTTLDSSTPVDSSLPADTGVPSDSAPVEPDSGADTGTPRDSGTAADTGSLQDSAIADASDAAPGVITVVVAGFAGGESGVPVVWGDANGNVVDTSATLTGGTAVTALPNVTMVTVVMGSITNPALYTAMNLVAGQTVVVEDMSSSVDTASSLQVPTAPTMPVLDDGGALTYRAAVGDCQSSSAEAPFTVDLSEPFGYQPCVGAVLAGGSFATALPVLVEADDSNGNPQGYATATGNPATALDDAGTLTASLPSTWSTTFAGQTVLFPERDGGGIPGSFAASEIVDSLLFPLNTYNAAASVDAGPNGLSTLVYTHPAFAQAIQYEAYFDATGDFDGISGSTAVMSALASSGPSTVTLDPSGLDSALVFQSSTTTIGAQPDVSWTLAGGSIAGEAGIVAVLPWDGGQLDGGGSQHGVWTIVAAGGAGVTSLTAPKLPPSLALYAPQPGAEENSTALFGLQQGTGVPSYSSVLEVGSLYQGYTNLCESASPMPPLPSLGTSIISFFGDESGC